MSLSQQELEQLVSKAISLYNRLRSPEITVKQISVTPVSVTVSFSGGFCYSCGVLDYVEGFAQQIKALSGKAELKVGKTRQITPRIFEVDYNVKTR
ncbi:MAG: hypothetical protein ABSF44_12370 [Candidatus Bathyarchaeia archaeon]|jgi:hypothetical protein